MKVIHLDYLASNPLLPNVQEAMIETINKNYGNPSSQHQIGDKAATALVKAREQVVRLINAPSEKEVVFTSGGTESVNHAVKGVAFANADQHQMLLPRSIKG